MLPRDRVLAVFEHRPTDIVPTYQAGLSSRVASAVLGREAYVGGGIQQWRESKALWDGEDAHREFLERSRQDAHDLARALDVDYVRPSYWRKNEKPTRRIDAHTFMFGDPDDSWYVMRFDPDTELYQVVDTSPGAVQTPRASSATLADIERHVEAAERSAERYEPGPASFADAAAALEVFGHERAVPGAGVGICVPREAIWLEAVALQPHLVARYLNAQAERAVRNAACQAGMGLRFLQGGGDFAGKNGPLYSPKAFHELMLPALQKVSAGCHEHGCFHMFASDGDLWPVAEDLFGASGVDAFYEIDRQAGMDLRRLRERYPELTLMGGISSETLHVGTREQVVAETLSAIEVAKQTGSIMVGCSNQVVAKTPIGNFMAMIETITNYR
jgi:uroporphyrinogen decarboxylase